MSRDFIKCGKNEQLRELFFLLAENIKARLSKLHLELNACENKEKYEYLLSKSATELFNLINCREKLFYASFRNKREGC
jgi:hypothetical protein